MNQFSFLFMKHCPTYKNKLRQEVHHKNNNKKLRKI